MSYKPLTFKFKLNRTVDIGGQIFTIPMQQKLLPDKNGRQRIVPVFDMDKVFELPLEDETVMVPEREEGMSDRVFHELEDEAYLTAREVRKRNDGLRSSAHYHQRAGIIEILHDPFAKRFVKDVQQASKPSELAKQMDDEKKKSKPSKDAVVDA